MYYWLIFMFLRSLIRMKERNAFSEITNWIKKHSNIPSILVGDFNMSKSQLESLLHKSSHQ